MEETLLQIQSLKKRQNAVVLAHMYQPGDIQDIADYVGDSYGLSITATEVEAAVIVFCGVQFMAETAAILNPEKKVILPAPDAGCPMADMITAAQLRGMKQKHPGHLVICYVNSTAAVKAESDICCTSSNALTIVQQLPAEQGILFVPDKHLGSWIREKTGREIVLWDGFCPTHVRLKPGMIVEARKKHHNALVMIHPEAPKESRDLADTVLSTSGMCKFARENPASEFIVATETGIIHTLEKQNPEKSFYRLSRSVVCPNMKRISLEAVRASLEGTHGVHVIVGDGIAQRARHSLVRMLEMSK